MQLYIYAFLDNPLETNESPNFISLLWHKGKLISSTKYPIIRKNDIFVIPTINGISKGDAIVYEVDFSNLKISKNISADVIETINQAIDFIDRDIKTIKGPYY